MNIRYSLLAVTAGCLFAASTAAQKTASEAQAALTAGNQRFVAGKSVAQPLGPGVRRTLARGQSPYAIVLCCADSRVPPEHVFNTGLGELFVVRVAGNCVDPEAIASIEYAAEHLGAQLCVVMGHERCGAIAAATKMLQAAKAGKPTAAESPALQHLLETLEPAVQRALALDLGGRELCDRAEAENAQGMAVEVLRRSPMLQQLQKLDRFTVLPARYHLDSGEVEWLPPRPLPPEPTAEAAPVHAAAPSMAPHVALRLLQAGHRRFLGDGRPLGDISPPRRQALVEGQQPFAIVVTCADSRLSPEHIFDAGLGELFVVRVAGNVITDDVLASVEYAAAHTGAPLLLVLGHSACGAVTAAAEHGDDPGLSTNLRALVERLQPAVERARTGGARGSDLVALAVRANAQRVVAQARQQSHILRELEHEGRFAMLAAVYDLASGDLEWLKDDGHAEPQAAPAGESRPAAGNHEAPAPAPKGSKSHGDAHGSDHDDGHGNAPSGAHGDAHGAEPSNGHGAAPAGDHGAGHDTPPSDGHDAGHSDAHGTPGQDGHGSDADPAHGDDHGQHAGGAHGAAAAGHELDWAADDAGAHDTNGGHGHDAEPDPDAKATDKQTAGTVTPVLVLGLTGIASLLLAATIALKTRG